MKTKFMKMAISLARKTNPYPNPRVGAVIVKNGKVIGKGYHKQAGMPHAEIEAIKDAKVKGGNSGSVAGATLYVTLEPCSHKMKRTPPCTDAIILEKIGKVVYGMKDPNPLVSGEALLRKAGIIVEGPVAEKEIRNMNKSYIHSMSNRAFVVIKMAMTADGKTATYTGESKNISGREEQKFVHKLRNEYDVVMVGAGTVIADDPKLTTRFGGGRDPIRIVVDGRLKIPLNSDVLQNSDGKTIIATSELAPKNKVEAIAISTHAHVFICGKKEVDLRTLVDTLSGMGMKKILIEGGSELNAKALHAGIVDRIYLSVAPKIIGGRNAKGVAGGEGIAKMNQAIGLKNLKIRKLGPDLLLQYDILKR